MDEKTKQLRDLFMEVAGDSTITESQADERGTLVDATEVDDKLQAVIGVMIDSYDIRTSLSPDDLVTVVKGFYAGENDAKIAAELSDSVSPKTVTRARINLHLVTDDDKLPSFDYGAFRQDLKAGMSIEALAEAYEVSPSTIKWYKMIVETEHERRIVGDRYRDEFSRILDDKDLSDQLTREIRDSGLREATEDIETNVSF